MRAMSDNTTNITVAAQNIARLGLSVYPDYDWGPQEGDDEGERRLATTDLKAVAENFVDDDVDTVVGVILATGTVRNAERRIIAVSVEAQHPGYKYDTRHRDLLFKDLLRNPTVVAGTQQGFVAFYEDPDGIVTEGAVSSSHNAMVLADGSGCPVPPTDGYDWLVSPWERDFATVTESVAEFCWFVRQCWEIEQHWLQQRLRGVI